MALTQIDDRGLKTPIDLIDNEKIRFGTGNDLEIYHTGSQSRIENSGTGELRIQADDIQITDKEANDFHIKCVHDGTVELYHDNSKKFETLSNGVKVTGQIDVNGGSISLEDSRSLLFGASDDLQIFHDGYNRICGDSLYINNKANTEQYIYCHNNGRVDLFYDNVRTFETEANGVIVKGPEGGDALLKVYADEGDDNADLWRLRSNASSSEFTIQNANNGGGWDTNILAVGDGAVELYHDGTKRLETSSTGVTIPDTLKITDTELSEASDNFTINIQSGNNDFYVKNGGTTIAAFKGSNKNLEITDGDLVIETAGHGINFHPHSGTDNLLDDYEEGTWSGSLIANSVPNTLYGTTTGHYTKIGREVKVSIKFDGVDVSGIASGNIIQIAGLPFTSINADDRDISSNFHTSNVGFDTSRTQKFMCAQNGTTFNGFETKDDSPGVVWYTNDWDSNNITMYFTGHYTT